MTFFCRETLLFPPGSFIIPWTIRGQGASNIAQFGNDAAFAATNSCEIGNRDKIATRITLRIQTPVNGP